MMGGEGEGRGMKDWPSVRSTMRTGKENSVQYVRTVCIYCTTQAKQKKKLTNPNSTYSTCAPKEPRRGAHHCTLLETDGSLLLYPAITAAVVLPGPSHRRQLLSSGGLVLVACTCLAVLFKPGHAGWPCTFCAPFTQYV